MATIARAPDTFDAAVPMAGIYDFADAYGGGDRVQKIFTKTGHGGAPEDRREIYALSNTLARIRNIKTPLLIMHGENDPAIPIRFGERLFGMANEPKRFVRFPGENHEMSRSGKPRHRLERFRHILEWFAGYLGKTT